MAGMARYQQSLEAAEKGLQIAEGNADLKKLRDTASQHLANSMLFKDKTLSRQVLTGEDRVMFRKAILWAAPDRTDGCLTLQEAAVACSRVPPDGERGWTIVLKPGDYNLNRFPIHIHTAAAECNNYIIPPVAYPIQIIGEIGIKHDQPTSSHAILIGSTLFCISGKGATLYLEDIECDGQAGTDPDENVIIVDKQSTLTARHCIFFSSTSPALAVLTEGTHTTLIACSFRSGSSAAAVCFRGAHLVMEGCTIQKCLKTGVDVREGATTELKDTQFLGCRRQAVSLYDGGKEAKLNGCLIERCGAVPSYSALLAECGVMHVSECKVRNNPSDAIVADGTPGGRNGIIFVDRCQIVQNGGGVMFGMRGASGVITDCTITGNASYGVTVHAVAKGKRVEIARIEIKDNGPGHRLDITIPAEDTNRVEMKGNRTTAVVHFPMQQFVKRYFMR
ncbi:hypothetical protein HDV00_008743 [Rhizophlyctis rosea]|nr:hypothetical protein HDV00_008743 [Rhizophlyctis rosea]